jgi:hypothetical protein
VFTGYVFTGATFGSGGTRVEVLGGPLVLRLTGNATSDDHTGHGWKNLNNGFATGLWAPSIGDADVVAALTAGRAVVAHVGRWPGGEIDMLVDGTVPMGSVSISSCTTRQIAIAATRLPTGSTVEPLAGPVDYTRRGRPGDRRDRQPPASAFRAGPATMQVATSAPRFYRPQVLGPTGQIIGAGNPVWLVRSQPPVPVPAARLH